MTNKTHPLVRQLCKQATIIEGKPWFGAKDVGTLLGYDAPSRTMGKLHHRHIDEFCDGDVRFSVSDDERQRKHGRAFSLSGLMKIAAHSRTDNAAVLRVWLASLLQADDALVHVLKIRGER